MEQLHHPCGGEPHSTDAQRSPDGGLPRGGRNCRAGGNYRPAGARRRAASHRIPQTPHPGTAAEMNYERAIEFLFSRVNFERLSGMQYSADDFKLDRMRALLRRLGDPQESIPAVHIAGTKGEGSTAALVAQMLAAAGIRTALFTSPHISAFEERMAVDGTIPEQRELAQLVEHVVGAVAELDKTPGQMSPTYFEIATAMAWLFFRDRQGEIAVLEVGEGGWVGATNNGR